jgi:hypothetical protein
MGLLAINRHVHTLLRAAESTFEVQNVDNAMITYDRILRDFFLVYETDAELPLRHKNRIQNSGIKSYRLSVVHILCR